MAGAGLLSGFPAFRVTVGEAPSERVSAAGCELRELQEVGV